MQDRTNIFVSVLICFVLGIAGCSGESGDSNVTESQPEAVDADDLNIEPPAQVTFLDWEMPENCPDGTMPVINKEGCQNIGAACPEGDWPENLELGADNLFVQVGGTGNGVSTDKKTSKC